MIHITVAGKRREYPEGLNVEQLIEAEQVESPLYVTVTINGEFVNNAERAQTVLHDGDEVEFLYFMGGGC